MKIEIRTILAASLLMFGADFANASTYSCSNFYSTIGTTGQPLQSEYSLTLKVGTSNQVEVTEHTLSGDNQFSATFVSHETNWMHNDYDLYSAHGDYQDMNILVYESGRVGVFLQDFAGDFTECIVTN